MTEIEKLKTEIEKLTALPCTRSPDGRSCTLTPGHDEPCTNGLVRWRAPQWKCSGWKIRWSRDEVRPQSVIEFDCRRSGEDEWERRTLLLSTDMDEQLRIFDRLHRGDAAVQHAVGLALFGPRMANVDGGEVGWIVGWSFKDNQPVLLSSMMVDPMSSGPGRRRALEQAQDIHRRVLDLVYAAQDSPTLLESTAYKQLKETLEVSRAALKRHEVEVDPVDENGCWPTCGCARE